VAIIDSIRSQIQKLKSEYKQRRNEILSQIQVLEKSLARLDAEYGAVLGTISGKRGAGARRPSTLTFGGVRSAVLDAIKSGRGLKPKQIVEKTGLAGPQVHNSLTGLRKSKEVKVKGGLYYPT
jgi:hypothetical protein